MMKFVQKHSVWLVVFVGLLCRTVYWVKKGGLFTRDGIFDVDGYLQTGKFMLNGQWAEILSFRPTQLSYPLLLLPVHLFNITPSTYVFLLHLVLTGLMLCFVFLSAKKLFGVNSALASMAIASLNYKMILWFNWLYTEVIYYFGVSFFIWISLATWQKRSALPTVAWLASALFIFFIKPESIALIAASSIVLLFQIARVRLSFKNSFAVVIATIVSGFVFLILALSHPKVRDKFLTHIHVAHGLYLSTTTGANRNGIEQEVAFQKRATIPNPGGGEINGRRIMSLTGLKFIRENPFKYLRLCYLRMTAILFPALYYDWQPISRLLDFLLSIVLVTGTLASCILAIKNRGLILGVFFCALSMLALTSLYLADGDARFRLPIYIVLTILAPWGFSACLHYLTKRLSMGVRRDNKKAAPPLSHSHF